MAGGASSLASTLLLLLLGSSAMAASLDYKDALGKSILFFESQRSGRLPPDQRVTWRSHSALEDGKASGIDLEGGYYDAGDNVKFGLPMAFTVTMLSWSVVEYGNQIAASGQLGYTMDAIKWGTDYFIKAHPEPNVLWGEVGDGTSDHECWQRPEDMSTSRKAYRVDASNPGSDLAGETAAAMAAASMVFRGGKQDTYAKLLLRHARELFTFADTYRGKYDSSIRVAQKYYASRSGFADELLWGAIWLYKATGEDYYLNYVANNAAKLGGTGWSMTEFSWDVKYAGIQVLASKILLEGKAGPHAEVLEQYKAKAEYFLCACLQQSSGSQVQRTPGGMMFIRQWNNMQYVTSGAFLLSVYSDYLTALNQKLSCSGRAVAPSELHGFAKSQVDYILGDNPRATSYLVGYGRIYPQQVHHRAASIVSFKVDSSFVGCKDGYQRWYPRKQADPNILIGALVGGPDEGDNFADERDNYEQTEPATYNNGPLVGLLAKLHILSNPSAAGSGARSDSLPLAAPVNHGSNNNWNEGRTATTTASAPSAVPSPVIPSPPPARPREGDRNLIDIRQTRGNPWFYRGDWLTRYEVVVTNLYKDRAIADLRLKITGLIGPRWGLQKMEDEDIYTFPAWRTRLEPQQSLKFVYIQGSQPAEVQLWHREFA